MENRFFEVRYEDLNKNRKYFYPYEGEGLRYEIKEFVSCIMNPNKTSFKLTREEVQSIIKVQELFIKSLIQFIEFNQLTL